MIIFPAIDLRQGRCVRLRQGDPRAETVFGEDPAAMARHWVAAGASWLHVVNLDGALEPVAAEAGAGDALPLNLQRLAEIRAAVDVPLQFGGGLRSAAAVELALELGATRVVLGTAAVQTPSLIEALLDRYGRERIVVGIDAREGHVATHGWAETSNVEASDLARRMRDLGVARVVYTDIARDGMLLGVNAQATAALARASGLRVIASGGVRDLGDITRLLSLADQGIEGVIVGQALYSGSLDLAEALDLARRQALHSAE